MRAIAEIAAASSVPAVRCFVRVAARGRFSPLDNNPPAMILSQLLLVLRVRRKLILLTLFWAVTLVMLMSVILPPSYKATATLVLNYTGIDPVTGLAYPGQMVPSYVQTQVGIIKSHASATRVVRELRLAQRPDLQKKFQKATEGQGNIVDWLAQRLHKNLEVVPARASNVVEVEYKAQSAKEAATVANAFATAYQESSLQLKMNPARSASAYLNQQMQTLRDNLMAAQIRLLAFQHEKGLSSTDGRYDVESMRLSELSAQLVQVQGQLMDAQSRLRNFNNGGGNELPEIVASPLVQNLRIALAQADANFTRIDERYTCDHPSWKQAKAELSALRGEGVVLDPMSMKPR